MFGWFTGYIDDDFFFDDFNFFFQFFSYCLRRRWKCPWFLIQSDNNEHHFLIDIRSCFRLCHHFFRSCSFICLSVFFFALWAIRRFCNENWFIDCARLFLSFFFEFKTFRLLSFNNATINFKTFCSIWINFYVFFFSFQFLSISGTMNFRLFRNVQSVIFHTIRSSLLAQSIYSRVIWYLLLALFHLLPAIHERISNSIFYHRWNCLFFSFFQILKKKKIPFRSILFVPNASAYEWESIERFIQLHLSETHVYFQHLIHSLPHSYFT